MKVSRIPFAAFALINLIIGFWTGLLRLGMDVPVTQAAAHHGAIMVGGFLGALITLEKVIPLKKKWYYIFPVITAASVIAFFSNLTQLGLIMQLAGSIGLVLVYIQFLVKERSAALVMMTIGTLWWAMGTLSLFSSKFYPAAFPWWMAFVFFTIVGERLELSRFLPVSVNARRLLWMLVLLMPVSILTPFHSVGRLGIGLSCVGASLWLLRYDVVRINLRKEGLIRYSGIALLIGYFFLALCGIFLLIGDQTLPYTYDVIVHVFFLGFTFCMIFAHGPIILPGVLGSAVRPYHPVLYFWLAGLVVSVLIRLVADGLNLQNLRHISGVVSLVSILGFFPTLGILVRRKLHS